MKITTNVTPVTNPSAHITKNKQRIKQHEKNIYLQNGDEFEIELFNPTSSKILAKIEINGQSLSNSGLVLRPGERVYLDRYFDQPKKFLFETYEINSNDSDAVSATKNNGNVTVKFFDEYKYYHYNIPNSGDIIFNSNATYNQDYIYTNYLGTFSNLNTPVASSFSTSNIETGRVEMGSNSNQTFTYDNSRFEYLHKWLISWNLLPESRKPLVSEDIKVFCTECGAKRKKDTFKFCPNCGTKF